MQRHPWDSEVWAFVDEYGNTDLVTEKNGVSKFFIVAVVIVKEEDLPIFRQEAEAIRAKFFQTGEMKSSKLGADRGRWQKLLNAIAKLPFHFYGLAVDKNYIIRSSGLQWKKSFYKNICGRAYGKLMRAFPKLHVRADQHGSSKFMESFSKYIEANHRPTLFDRGTFEFLDGKLDVAVQLADILAGALARAYDPDKQTPRAGELIRIISDRSLLIDEWPVKYRVGANHGEIVVQGDINERIAHFSMNSAEEFIEKNENTVDEDVSAQVAVLERLLFERRFGDTSRAVPTGQLLDNLRDRGLAEKGETWFRRSIIAPMRDRGVLLTSSPLGYKLPDRESDLITFVRHAESVCVPMLNRVNSACAAVKLATLGEVDILMENSLAVVKRLVDELDKHQSVTELIEP